MVPNVIGYWSEVRFFGNSISWCILIKPNCTVRDIVRRFLVNRYWLEEFLPYSPEIAWLTYTSFGSKTEIDKWASFPTTSPRTSCTKSSTPSKLNAPPIFPVVQASTHLSNSHHFHFHLSRMPLCRWPHRISTIQPSHFSRVSGIFANQHGSPCGSHGCWGAAVAPSRTQGRPDGVPGTTSGCGPGFEPDAGSGGIHHRVAAGIGCLIPVRGPLPTRSHACRKSPKGWQHNSPHHGFGPDHLHYNLPELHTSSPQE